MDDPRRPRTLTIWEACSHIVHIHGEYGLAVGDGTTQIAVYWIYEALESRRGADETSEQLLKLASEIVTAYEAGEISDETIGQLETEMDRISAERAARYRTRPKSATEVGL